ncbi:MAG: calcium-binding protein [Tepidisphaeraceae bacterium]
MKTRPTTAVTNARRCELHPLESRQLFTVDLIPFTSLLPGAYAQGDVIPVIVTVDNLEGTTATPSPVSYKAVLTRDQTIGNADDILIAQGAFDPIPANNGDGIQTELTITGAMAAGDYFLAMQANVPAQFAETDTTNNTVFSPTTVCRITTEELTNPTILGTAGNDLITIEQHSDNDVVTVNGVSYYYDTSETAFDHLFIDGGSGNDKILVIDERVSIDLFITGSGGNDTIQGGNGDDELSGANGKDKLFGGSGRDYLLGGASADYLTGGHGDDTMSGAGGNDRLEDHFNKDYFLGGAGNDVFITRDAVSNEWSDPDTISGGAGNDRAQADSGPYTDLTASIEELLA